MSRPLSDGLMYFYFDCDFFNLKSTKIIKKHFGAEGIIVYLYILCDIYKKGYYVDIDEDYKDILSNDLHLTENKVNDLLDFYTKRGMFDLESYQNSQVLTSKEIQLLYQEAVKMRAKKNRRTVGKHWILEPSETKEWILRENYSENNDVLNDSFSEKNNSVEELNSDLPTDNNSQCNNSDSNSKNNCINKIKENKRKENEIKENKNKEKERKEEDPSGNSVCSVSVVDFYKNYFNSVSLDEDEKSLQRLIEQYGEDDVLHSLEIAINNGVPKLRYAVGVLKKQNGGNSNESTKRNNQSDDGFDKEFGTVF